MKKAIVIAAAFVFTIVMVSYMGEPSLQRVFVWNSFIGSGHYAVTERGSSGYSLFFGPIERSPSVVVQSQGFLEGEFIAGPSRLLVTERAAGGKPRFRLLEVNITDSAVTCRRLIESDEYIAWPVVPEGIGPDDVIFFHGEYHPEYSGPSVTSWKKAVLHDGVVKFPAGPSFVAISRPAQVADGRFIALLYRRKYLDSDGSSGPDEFNPVYIDVTEMPIKIEPVTVSGMPSKGLHSITSLPEVGLTFVGWIDSDGGRRYNISTLSLIDNSISDTIRLAKGRYYGPFYAESIDGGKLVGRVLSVEAETEGRNGVFWITEFSGGQALSERPFKLEAARMLDTANCSPAETQF